ncbi:MAG: ABC transporter substrate-binding protein [Phycisphaerae bacterium]
MNKRTEGKPAVWMAAGIVALWAGGCRSKPAPKRSAVGGVPERIVTLAPNAAEIIAALGEADRLVGVSRYCRDLPEVKGLPRVGGLVDPDVEAILQSQADLVVIRGRIPAVERLCEAEGIRLHRDPTERYEDIFTAITQLGSILGCPEKAEGLIGGIRGRVARIEAAVADLPRPRVLFTTNREPDSLSRVTTAGRPTFVSAMIEMAGGRNVFGDRSVAYPEVGLEDILVAQPEVIIEVMPQIDQLTPAIRDRIIRQWRRLGSMPATEHDRVYVLIDSDLIVPSARVADSVRRLARLLHPEVTID